MGRKNHEKIRTLVVEHIASDAELMIRSLKKGIMEIDHRVVGDKKGFEKELESLQPDIILCDYRLPSFDAPQALRILQGSKKEIPFILVSGSIGEDLAVEALKSGATDYVMKNNLEKLPLAVKRALAEQRNRIKAQEHYRALQESEARYRTLVETQTDAICRWLPDTTITFANRAYGEYLGSKPEDLLGKKWIDFIPKESQKEVLERYRRLGPDEKKIEYEHQAIIAGGIIRWMSWIDVPIRDDQGQIREFQSIGRDITEIKKAQEDIKKISSLLLKVQRLSKIGCWEWDVNNKVTYWTDEVYRILDIDPSEISPGSPEHIAKSLACYSEEDRLRLEKAFNECLVKGTPYEMVCRFTTAKGRKLWIRTAGQAELERGQVVRVYGDIQDITEQYEVQEQLRRQYQELKLWQETMLGREDRIRELKAEVNALLKELGRPKRYVE